MLVLIPTFLPAQDFRGSLLGTVSDSSGARVAGASIELHAVESPVERRGASDARGQFRFDDLQPGTYSVKVSSRGFAEAQSQVNVVVSSVREIGVTMSPASVSQTLNVAARASSIATQPMDTTSAVHGGTVTSKDLETIPLGDAQFR